MSYDLALVRVPAGADPLEFARAEAERETDAPAPAPGWRERMDALAAALTAADPSLVARRHTAGVVEEHVELNGPEEGPGLQVLLFADAAYVHLPYWHAGEDAHRAWEQAWAVLRVLQREGGYVTYDPQADAVLDLDADRDTVLGAYGSGVAAAQALSAAPLLAAQNRPWWKFWG